jgi:hypothetical protein
MGSWSGSGPFDGLGRFCPSWAEQQQTKEFHGEIDGSPSDDFTTEL